MTSGEQDDRPMLILSPTSGMNFTGGEEVTADCGHRCWLSPGSLEAYFNPRIRSVCSECAGGHEYIAKKLDEGAFELPDPREVATALRQLAESGDVEAQRVIEYILRKEQDDE